MKEIDEASKNKLTEEVLNEQIQKLSELSDQYTEEAHEWLNSTSSTFGGGYPSSSSYGASRGSMSKVRITEDMREMIASSLMFQSEIIDKAKKALQDLLKEVSVET